MAPAMLRPMTWRTERKVDSSISELKHKHHSRQSNRNEIKDFVSIQTKSIDTANDEMSTRTGRRNAILDIVREARANQVERLLLLPRQCIRFGGLIRAVGSQQRQLNKANHDLDDHFLIAKGIGRRRKRVDECGVIRKRLLKNTSFFIEQHCTR